MPQISNLVKNLEMSGIREIMNIALGMDDVVRLEIGEPLFETPPHIVQAGCKGAEEGYTKYTANPGMLDLRKELSKYINGRFGLETSYENIVVTVGAIGGISTVLRGLVDEGDEILIPDPSWPSYNMIVDCNGGVPVYYKLDEDKGYIPSFEDLEKKITKKTKAIIVNTPSNPLGVVYDEDVIKDIIEFAKEKDIFVISDEVYEKIVFEGDHISMLPYDTDGRVIGVFSFSKTYSMTGWRVGYVVADARIAKEVGKLQEAYVSCASSVSQRAALGALKGSQSCVDEMVNVYDENRKVAMELLDKYNLEYKKPEGAFYIWIKVGCEDSTEFAKEFLKEKNVSVAPGDTFGPSGKEFIRISLASKTEDVKVGDRKSVV